MEHAINHSLGFKIYLKWLFHTIKFIFYIMDVWNTPVIILLSL